MNKYLTLEEKQSLVNMLQKYYTIEEEPFISNLAEDDEEKVELTLKAFSLAQRTQEAKAKLVQEKDEKSDFIIVKIDHLNNHLYLVKAIKEVCKIDLAQAKEMVDSIRSHFNDGTSIWNPFKVGDTSDCKFSFEHWSRILTQILTLADEHNTKFKWHYV